MNDKPMNNKQIFCNHFRNKLSILLENNICHLDIMILKKIAIICECLIFASHGATCFSDTYLILKITIQDQYYYSHFQIRKLRLKEIK